MAIDPNPSPLLVPLVSECFTKAARPVSIALMAAGQPDYAQRLNYAAEVVSRMSSTSEFEALTIRQVLDAAGQLPALHGSQDLHDLQDLVRIIAEQALPEWQRSKQPVPCLANAQHLKQQRRAVSGPDDLL